MPIARVDVFVGELHGVTSFDGTTWSRHLQDRRITDLGAAPDGSVWVADVGSRENGESLYVITVEAAEATE